MGPQQTVQGPLNSSAKSPDRFEHQSGQTQGQPQNLSSEFATSSAPESSPSRSTSTPDSLSVSNPFAIKDFDPMGTPYSGSHRYPIGHFVNPHRGGMILTLGMLAVVCNLMLIPGLLAWILGRSDLSEIRAGRMDRSGKALTQTGMILGIVFTLIPMGVVALFLFIFALTLMGIV